MPKTGAKVRAKPKDGPPTFRNSMNLWRFLRKWGVRREKGGASMVRPVGEVSSNSLPGAFPGLFEEKV